MDIGEVGETLYRENQATFCKFREPFRGCCSTRRARESPLQFRSQSTLEDLLETVSCRCRACIAYGPHRLFLRTSTWQRQYIIIGQAITHTRPKAACIIVMPCLVFKQHPGAVRTKTIALRTRACINKLARQPSIHILRQSGPVN